METAREMLAWCPCKQVAILASRDEQVRAQNDGPYSSTFASRAKQELAGPKAKHRTNERAQKKPSGRAGGRGDVGFTSADPLACRLPYVTVRQTPDADDGP